MGWGGWGAGQGLFSHCSAHCPKNQVHLGWAGRVFVTATAIWGWREEFIVAWELYWVWVWCGEEQNRGAAKLGVLCCWHTEVLLPVLSLICPSFCHFCPPCVSPLSFCSDRGTVSDHSLPCSRGLITYPNNGASLNGHWQLNASRPTYLSRWRWDTQTCHSAPPVTPLMSILGHATSTWDEAPILNEVTWTTSRESPFHIVVWAFDRETGSFTWHLLLCICTAAPKQGVLQSLLGKGPRPCKWYDEKTSQDCETALTSQY